MRSTASRRPGRVRETSPRGISTQPRGPLISVATRCPSIDAFIEKFAGFASEGALVLPTSADIPVGTEGRFVIFLQDKSEAMRGRCRVVEVKAVSKPGAEIRRTLARVTLLEMDSKSANVHLQLLACRRSPAVASNSNANLELTQVAPAEIPPPPLARPRVPPPVAAAFVPTLIGAPPYGKRDGDDTTVQRSPPETQVPGAAFTLPANPLSELESADLASFIECTLFESEQEPELDIVVVAPVNNHVAATPPPLAKTPPPLVKTPPPLVKTPPPLVKTPPPLAKMPPPLAKTPPPLAKTPIANAPPPVAASAPPLSTPTTQPSPVADAAPVTRAAVAHPIVIAAPSAPLSLRARFIAASAAACAVCTIIGLVIGHGLRPAAQKPIAPPTPAVTAGLLAPPAPPPARLTAPAVADKPPADAPPRRAAGGDDACTARIVTEPADAKVTWGRRPLGRTPIAHAVVPCGEAAVTLQHERYQDVTRTVTVEAGASADIAQRLRRPPGTLVVTSSPPRAYVTVNNEPLGQAPRRLGISRFERISIRASLPGYQPWTKTIYVKEPITKLSAQLAPTARASGGKRAAAAR